MRSDGKSYAIYNLVICSSHTLFLSLFLSIAKEKAMVDVGIKGESCSEKEEGKFWRENDKYSTLYWDLRDTAFTMYGLLFRS